MACSEITEDGAHKATFFSPEAGQTGGILALIGTFKKIKKMASLPQGAVTFSSRLHPHVTTPAAQLHQRLSALQAADGLKSMEETASVTKLYLDSGVKRWDFSCLGRTKEEDVCVWVGRGGGGNHLSFITPLSPLLSDWSAPRVATLCRAPGLQLLRDTLRSPPPPGEMEPHPFLFQRVFTLAATPAPRQDEPVGRQ